MEILSIQPAGIQVTFRMPLEDIEMIVKIAEKIEVKFDSREPGEVAAKDVLVEHLKMMKKVVDDIGS